MKRTEEMLLSVLRAAICGEPVQDPQLTAEEWKELFTLSESHKLLPIILDAVCALPSFRSAASGNSSPQKSETASGGKAADDPWTAWRSLAIEQAGRQAIQENQFLNLILALRARGLEPVVMKGAVCRALYPRPLLRPSVDDDLLIYEAQAPAFHSALLELGLTADDPQADPQTAWELSYHMPDSPLYVELHKHPFDPDADAFVGFNEPFTGAMDRAVSVTVQDVTLKTLAPTDHLLFMLLHAFKHFLFSGFGIRIVADICLYTWTYGEQIDFAQVFERCAARRSERFVAAVYRIGEKYLDLPVPERFAVLEVDETDLLTDILASGLHGAKPDRLHSAAITLGAVADSNTGKARSGGLHKTLFPSAAQISAQYPYLDKRPWLLPVAWGQRVGAFMKNRERYGKQNPAASLRIGKERVELLERYGVIDA